MLKCLNAKMNRGFTLIEMLVAITTFSLVIGSVMGIFISAIRSQTQALATQKLLDETSYVIEYMGRALRMAKKDMTGSCLNAPPQPKYNYQNPDGNTSAIRFLNYNDKCQEFFKEGTLLKERKSLTAAYDPNQPALELTSSDLVITSLQFNLSGQDQTDYLQPRVTISMTIKRVGPTGPEIKIQTSISQRNLDVQQRD